MKIIRKSQIAVISLAIMVMIAGYVNYKYNPDREESLGQTVFVNSQDAFMYNGVDVYKESNDSTNTVNKKENLYENKSTNATSTAGTDDTIAAFRATRNNMFSEMEANYEKVISNTAVSKEQVQIYQDKLNKLIEDKNLITLVENIIKTKGIEDIVIVPTNGNINVIVKSKAKLTTSQIAIVQKTIVDELKVDVKKITIQES